MGHGIHRCGFAFVWLLAHKPAYIAPNGIIIPLIVQRRVPYISLRAIQDALRDQARAAQEVGVCVTESGQLMICATTEFTEAASIDKCDAVEPGAGVSEEDASDFSEAEVEAEEDAPITKTASKRKYQIKSPKEKLRVQVLGGLRQARVQWVLHQARKGRQKLLRLMHSGIW